MQEVDTSNSKISIGIVLFLIVLLGGFLRGYHFREWLYFSPDQARDAMLTEDVVDGRAPWPLLGSAAAATSFRVGPIYNYFQIIFASIFGMRPEVLAYPDLVFSIGAIVSLYFFLRCYFNSTLTISLTFLYAISFEIIRYSRYALNSNPIPFFTLAFLLSLYKFLREKEKTSIFWIVLAGVCLGIGVQLQTIPLVLFPLFCFCIFVFMMARDRKVWRKWAILFGIAFFLNIPQLVSEKETNFSNTKAFFALSSHPSTVPVGSAQFMEKGDITEDIWMYVFCHVQASTFTLSALGNPNQCDFFQIIQNQNFNFSGMLRIFYVVASFIFVLSGYGLLLYYFQYEKDENKKGFLGIIILFLVLSVFIVAPVAFLGVTRHYLYMAFVPFLFLGLAMKFLAEKFPKQRVTVIMGILFALIVCNVKAIESVAGELVLGSNSTGENVILGEAMPMINYIASQSSPQKEIYLYLDGPYGTYATPFSFLLRGRGLRVRVINDLNEISLNVPIYGLQDSSDSLTKELSLQYSVKNYRVFGRVCVYQLVH